MLDCKLDALIRSFAWEKRFSCQHRSSRITWPLTLTLTLSTPWMQAYLETIVCKFGGDPAICLRELMVGANSHEFITLCTLWTNWLQYLAPPPSRAGEVGLNINFVWNKSETSEFWDAVGTSGATALRLVSLLWISNKRPTEHWQLAVGHAVSCDKRIQCFIAFICI